jgi:hypothetical protein
MTDWLRAMTVGVAALCCVSTVAGAPGATDYTETTTVEGKLPFDLRGAWLLVAHPEISEGKLRTLPQLLKVSTNQDGALTMHLLDVRLPKQIDEAAKKADRALTPWTPSEKDLAALRKQWATLPRAAKKDVAAGDVAYGEVRFTLAAPERYGEVFPTQDDKLKAVLAESAFSLQIEERYRPLPQPAGSNIAQVALRKTIYGVRNPSGTLLEGRQLVGWVAGGPGGAIPLNFSGPFKMYRLAAPDGKK